MSIYTDDIIPGDVVAVNHGIAGRKEGLVIGSHYDYMGRQILEVQLEHEVYNAWYPSVTRVRRTVSYNKPLTLGTTRRTTVERRVIW
ncbi:hypothetical protein CPB85DRAFT_1436176 [Mucidula mucida]|nr:hypothetical protein CPB85DRAFT_1436176 [Mucidula mucida]